MYTYIKLTREDGTTHNGMFWDVGVTNRATGKGNKLCTSGVLHVYDTPEQAVFMQPIHAPTYTRAWEVKSDDEGISDGTKRGIKSCTVVREITLPEITTEQRVEIAIRVSLSVYQASAYVEWANRWLSGDDRSSKAADVAAKVAYATADAAARAGARAGAHAEAYIAAHAAIRAAAYTADAAYTAACKDDVAYTTAHATDAAHAVVYAASAAGHIDLQSIIEEVLG